MKYTDDQLNTMRTKLALHEVENMEDDSLFDILMQGCTGWNNMSDEEVVEHFDTVFGDPEDFFDGEAEDDADEDEDD